MKDIFGEEISVGDYVFSDNVIYKVFRITDKMLAVKSLAKMNKPDTKYRYIYPYNAIKLEEEKVIFYMMNKK